MGKRIKVSVFPGYNRFHWSCRLTTGIHMDSDKITAIKIAVPRNVHEVRQFVGLAPYYRRFIKDFARLSSPLTDLITGTEKFRKITWSPEADAAFAQLKDTLCKEPVLALPDFSKEFLLETDASHVAIGAVLSQQHGKHSSSNRLRVTQTQTSGEELPGS